MISSFDIITKFRAVLLDAEVVIITATGELVGIRSGEFDAGVYTRPDAPAQRPVVVEANLAVIERSFDPSGPVVFVQESYLPAVEAPVATYTDELVAIMQYSIIANSVDGVFSLGTVHDLAKYIKEVFDPEKVSFSSGQTDNYCIAILNVYESPALPSESQYTIPVTINFRAYNHNIPL